MINRTIVYHVCFSLFALYGCQHDVHSYSYESPNDWRVIFKEFIDSNQLDKVNEKDILILSRGRYSKSVDSNHDYIGYSIGGYDSRGYDISYSSKRKLDGGYSYRMDFNIENKKNMCITTDGGKLILGDEGVSIVNAPRSAVIDEIITWPKDYANKIYRIEKRFGNFKVFLTYRYEKCLASAMINNNIVDGE